MIQSCDRNFRIFVLAAETSADHLGGAILKALHARGCSVSIEGVGGPLMEKEGKFSSLVDGNVFTHIGPLGLIKNLRALWHHITFLKAALIRINPHLLLTIDSPELAWRMASFVKRQGLQAFRVHVVAPSVWSWREKRAKDFAKTFHKLCTLFPDEASIFEKKGLSCTFVGHPVAEQAIMSHRSKEGLRNKAEGQKVYPTIALLPGSRIGEITRLLPLFLQACTQVYRTQNLHASYHRLFYKGMPSPKENQSIAKNSSMLKSLQPSQGCESFPIPLNSDIHNRKGFCCDPIFQNTPGLPRFSALVLTLPHRRALVEAIIQKSSLPFQLEVVVSPREQGLEPLRGAHLALTACGSVTLGLARLGIPMIAAYQTDFLTEILVRLLRKNPFWACLVNRLHKRCMIPELLQENSTVPMLAMHLYTFLTDPTYCLSQQRTFSETIQCLKDSGKFGINVAHVITNFLAMSVHARRNYP